MKRIILLAAVLVACSKSNDVSTLHQEAVNVANYYQPKLDALDKRVQDIFKRGTTIPANLPGIEEVGKRLTEARDTIVQLRGIVAKGPDGKSAVQKQADLAAKDHKVADLEKLIEDTEKTLEHGTNVVEDDLWSVESWIALYDQGINKATGPNTAVPEAAPPAGEPPTAAPGNTTTPPGANTTGQPSGAAATTRPAATETGKAPAGGAGAGSAAKAPAGGAGAGSAAKAPAGGAAAGAGSAAKH